MSENQTWQEQLQQRAGDLVARRLGDFAEELQTVQTALNGLRERAQAGSATVTAEETAGLQECLEQARYTAVQEVETGYQTRLEQAVHQTREETAAQLRQEYEVQLQDVRTQLEAAQASDSGLVQGLSLAGAGVAMNGIGSGVPSYTPLRAAIEEIDAQRQQADVLSTLVRHAAQYAPRAVFFVIKSGNAIGWKAFGFTNGLTDETVRALNLSLQANPLLNDATTTLQTATVQDAATGVLGNFDSSVAQAIALPLVIRGKAAAVLYADSGSGESPMNLDALESLMHVTSMAIELLPVRRNQPAAPAAAPPTPATTPSVPQPESVQARPFAYKPEPDEVPAVSNSFGTPAPTVAAEVKAEVKEVAPSGVPSSNVATLQSDEEVRAHNDARRFARLLVSEIKLYNEQKVVEGRRLHDLYERLKEDIDRSRQMYEKRVSTSVAAKFDYFYDELLHTLGEGDPGKLGSGCPGPTVPVS